MDRQLLSSLDYDTSTTTSEFVTNCYISVPLGIVAIIIYCIVRRFFASTFEVRKKYSEVLVFEDDNNATETFDESDISLDETRAQTYKSDKAKATSTIKHPKLSEGFFYWLYEIWSMDTATFLKYGGLDALVFRLYLKGCIYICLAALPYSLIVLLPVYITGQVHSSDALEMLTIDNVSDGSNRLYATVIGAYIFISIAYYYLSKVYLVVAYAADQNFVYNVDPNNPRYMEQINKIDGISWFNYYDMIETSVQGIAGAVTMVSGAVTGVVTSAVDAATSLVLTGPAAAQADLSGNRQADDTDVVDLESDGPEKKSADDETTGLLKAGGYGSVDNYNVNVSETNVVGSDISLNRVPIDRYTVMIRDLPLEFQNEQRMKAFMNGLFPNKIQKIFMLYDVLELTTIYKEIKKHEKLLHKVARKNELTKKNILDDNIDELPTINQGTKCCGKCGSQYEVIKFHRNELHVLKEQFMDAKRRLTTSPTVFVTFNNLESAAICATCPIRFGLLQLKIHKAPSSRDLRWHNLKYSSRDVLPSNAIVWGLILLIMVFWSIPVAAIQALANLESVFSEFGIDLSNYLNDTTLSWLEGWCSVLVLDIWLKILPILSEKLTNIQKKSSRGTEEIMNMTKYFDFLLVMVLLVTVLAGTVFSSLSSLVSSLNKIISLLATGLSAMSTYFMLYILLNAFIWLPLELFRPTYFIIKLFNLSEPNRFKYSNWYAKTMLILLICVTYSIMSPIIWLLGLAYFIFCFIVFSYQLSTAYIPAFETGAMIFPSVFCRLALSFNIVLLTWVGILALKTGYVEAALVLPWFVIINVGNFVLHMRFRRIFRAASLTSANRKDRELNKLKQNLGHVWNEKEDNMEFYPPIMDINYPNYGQSGLSVQ